jgi:hypothetical protein
MLKRPFPTYLLLLVALLLAGCTRGVEVPTSTVAIATTGFVAATATVAPTSILSPISTATATATPTMSPTLTATTRATPSATPATPTRSGSPSVVAGGTPTIARPGPPVYPTQPRSPGQPVVRTEHYAFFDPEGAHGATIALYAAEAEAIYAYVADRTGLRVAAPIPVVLQTQATSDCAARGVAYRDGGRISILVAPTTSAAQLRMVLAHETTHVLHMPRTAANFDITLVEGFANWASLRYWSDWQGRASFDDAVRGYLAEGRFVAVDDPPVDCTIAGRDVIYNERASFVGFLIDRYGLDRFLAASDTAVPVARANMRFIADYETVYGKSQAALLEEWLAALGR